MVYAVVWVDLCWGGMIAAAVLPVACAACVVAGVVAGVVPGAAVAGASPPNQRKTPRWHPGMR